MLHISIVVLSHPSSPTENLRLSLSIHCPYIECRVVDYRIATSSDCNCNLLRRSADWTVEGVDLTDIKLNNAFSQQFIKATIYNLRRSEKGFRQSGYCCGLQGPWLHRPPDLVRATSSGAARWRLNSMMIEWLLLETVHDPLSACVASWWVWHTNMDVSLLFLGDVPAQEEIYSHVQHGLSGGFKSVVCDYRKVNTNT